MSQEAPRVVAIDTRSPDRAILARAGALLRAGRLVAFPTETVYGLGANALDAAAVARIFTAKDRPLTDPVIVHIADLAQIDDIVTTLSPVAQQLIDRFWPGPLTLVLARGDRVPASVSAGMATVAVRMPSHPVALALIRAAERPIAAPSANRFSRPSATTAAHVVHDLGDRVDLVLDAGPTTIGLESTIVDVSGAGAPVLLRPGGLPVETLEAVCGPLARHAAVADPTAPQPAPGLLLRHYSPRATMVVVLGERQAARHRLQQEMQKRCADGTVVGALLVDEDRDLIEGVPVRVAWLGCESRLDDVAERLFAAMRELDDEVAVICARDVGAGGLGLAIRDRLTRAAAGQVIHATARPSDGAGA